MLIYRDSIWLFLFFFLKKTILEILLVRLEIKNNGHDTNSKTIHPNIHRKYYKHCI